MLMTFSILGFIGGILCAIGDILFDLKGKGNQKTGPGGNVDTNWIKMADWRFVASIICAFFGDILVMLGIYSLGMQIAENNQTLERMTVNHDATGSSPVTGASEKPLTIRFKGFFLLSENGGRMLQNSPILTIFTE